MQDAMQEDAAADGEPAGEHEEAAPMHTAEANEESMLQEQEKQPEEKQSQPSLPPQSAPSPPSAPQSEPIVPTALVNLPSVSQTPIATRSQLPESSSSALNDPTTPVGRQPPTGKETIDLTVEPKSEPEPESQQHEMESDTHLGGGDRFGDDEKTDGKHTEDEAPTCNGTSKSAGKKRRRDKSADSNEIQNVGSVSEDELSPVYTVNHQRHETQLISSVRFGKAGSRKISFSSPSSPRRYNSRKCVQLRHLNTQQAQMSDENHSAAMHSLTDSEDATGGRGGGGGSTPNTPTLRSSKRLKAAHPSEEYKDGHVSEADK